MEYWQVHLNCNALDHWLYTPHTPHPHPLFFVNSALRFCHLFHHCCWRLRFTINFHQVQEKQLKFVTFWNYRQDDIRTTNRFFFFFSLSWKRYILRLSRPSFLWHFFTECCRVYLHTTASEMRIRFKSTHLTLTEWTVESTLAALIETVDIYGQGPRLTLGSKWLCKSKLVWEPDDYISVENISHNITVFCSIWTKY